MINFFAATILFFIPTNTFNIHSNIIQEWKNQVALEGWTVNQQLVESSIFTESAQIRTNKVKFILDKTAQIKPKAVFFLGPVARIATGWSGPDGHNARCHWNDFFYNGCVNWSQLIDNKNYTNPPTGLFAYKNLAGDGRFDLSFVVSTSKWAVGRVDFSNLPLISRGLISNTNSLFYGKEKVPLINENFAISNYLRRNINYRKGLSYYKTNACVNSSYLNMDEYELMKNIRLDVKFEINNSFSSGNPFRGQSIFMFYLQGQDFRNAHYLSSLTSMLNVIWFANYRSYEHEQTWENNPNQQGDQGNRRWLQYALFVTWGPPQSKLLEGPTLADGYQKLYGRQNVYGSYIQIDGDPTLPLTVKYKGGIVSRPTNLRIIE